MNELFFCQSVLPLGDFLINRLWLTALIGSPPGKTKLNAIEEEPEEIKTFKVFNEGTGSVWQK